MISFIIPHYNGWPLLKKCLESILAAKKEAKIKSLELIIVDNASTDQSLNNLKEIKFGTSCHLKILKNKTNQGFAKAVNQGAKEAKGDWLAVCNNDLKLDPLWLTQTIKIIKDPLLSKKYSTIFGLVLNHNGTHIESEGLEFFVHGKAQNIKNGQLISPQTLNHYRSQPPHEIWGASASLVLYYRSDFLKLGGFDQDFFAYEEDVDLALRLNLSGLKTLFIPSAISYHLGGATSSLMGNFRTRMDTKNWFFIILKNYSLKTILQNLIPISKERLRNLSGLVKQTIKIYKLSALWQLPLSLLSVYFQVLIKLPIFLKKRTGPFL